MKSIGPLSGLKILDLTHVLAGPFCTLILAQQGAEVAKIERPSVGDSARSRGPYRTGSDGRKAHGEIMHLGRNKHAVAIDLSSDQGRALFLDLVRVSDVVVENFRPGVMERLGLGYETIAAANPKVIYASISGFGDNTRSYESPYRDRPAFNQIVQAMSGVMDITGDADGPPVATAIPLGDFIPAFYCAIGILSAVWERERTGTGQRIEVAMYDAMIATNVRALLKYGLEGKVQRRGAELFSTAMGMFQVADGYVTTTVAGEDMWARLCEMIGDQRLRSDPRLSTDSLRGKNFESIIRPILEEWAEARSKNDVADLFIKHDLPCGPVQTTEDVFNDPQVAARRMLVEVGDMVGSIVKMPGNPIKRPGRDEVPPVAAEWLGDGTAEVLSTWLGLSREHIEDLDSRGVVVAKTRAVEL